jgi:ABC-type branched-subunit amino acid transport system permease subunit
MVRANGELAIEIGEQMPPLTEHQASVVVSALLASYRIFKHLMKMNAGNFNAEMREIEEALVVLGFDPDKVN